MLGQNDEVDQRLWVATVLEHRETPGKQLMPPGPRLGLPTHHCPGVGT